MYTYYMGMFSKWHNLQKFISDKNKVQAGIDQEKAQEERGFFSINRGGEKLTIRYLYHENIT